VSRLKLPYETTRAILIAVGILGLLALAYGVYLFVNARTVIAEAADIQAQINDLPPEQAQAVLSAVPPAVLIRQRQALQDQNLSLIVGGIGLVGLGLAWLGLDIVGKGQQKAPVPDMTNRPV
jgi:hypothetical protein